MSRFKACCLLMLWISYNSAFATSNWKCTVYDVEKKTWTVQGSYQKSVLNKAFAACKKASNSPLSCKVSESNCEGSNQGTIATSDHLGWRCSALDRKAGFWQGNYFPARDGAAIGARDFCKSKSSVPETCYINWSSCHRSEGIL